MCIICNIKIHPRRRFVSSSVFFLFGSQAFYHSYKDCMGLVEWEDLAAAVVVVVAVVDVVVAAVIAVAVAADVVVEIEENMIILMMMLEMLAV
jgi:hypothetical protein